MSEADMAYQQGYTRGQARGVEFERSRILAVIREETVCIEEDGRANAEFEAGYKLALKAIKTAIEQTT